jgi:hypothetical protein
MTSELAERLITSPRLIFSIRCTVGVLVLLPAFIVWMQFGILDNVARSKGVEGNWHALLIPLATIAYLVGLGVWVFTRRRSFVRDGYLILYCGYIAGLLMLISSGNFLHQLALYGPVMALTNHLEDFVYLAPPVVFLIDRLIMVLSRQHERSTL